MEETPVQTEREVQTGEPINVEENVEQEEKAIKKSNILTKLKRLLPGNSSSLAAIQTQTGRVTGDPKGMAEALREHWERTFKAPLVDGDLMCRWLERWEEMNRKVRELDDESALTDKQKMVAIRKIASVGNFENHGNSALCSRY